MKICVIGLDCLEPSLVDRWLADLPTFARLRAIGAWGTMRSCVPPITVPAWSCMMSGRDPGELGIYGFRNRTAFGYDALAFATSEWVKVPRLWDDFSCAGKSCVLIGVPGTYPIKSLNGTVISDFLTPSLASEWTSPASLREDIRQWLDGEDYLFDVADFRSSDKARILADIHTMTQRRFTVARQILRRGQPDFFMMVEMGTDRIHHGFWHMMDSSHRKYEPGHPLADAIHDYYVAIDREIARLLELIDLRETSLLIISDHGAKRLDGGICVNEWLRKEGYLALKSEPPSAGTPLTKCDVDWTRTTAWAEGGYYGRIFLNVRGREPHGVVEPREYERTRGDLAHHLAQVRDDRGQAIATRSYLPQKLYRRVEGIAPDLITIFGDLHWRAVGTLGWNSLHTFENDTGPDEANHAQDGFYTWVTPGVAPSIGAQAIDILDVYPTFLRQLGLEPAVDLAGKARIFGGSASGAYTAQETSEIESRLEALGYLG